MGGTSIAGGKQRRVQQRKPRVDGWTKTKRAAFLDHLAETCNISLSAARVGMRPSGVHALRRRDAEFAELCRVALHAGYDRLEEQLIQHAGGSVNDVAIGETAVPAMPFDPKLALDLLRAHRTFIQTGRSHGGPAIRRVPRAEVIARLIKKLDALDKRLAKEAPAGGQAPK